jgi:autotransporter translocation and assembly factor TamB
MAFVAEARRWLRELAVTLVILAAGALLAVALIIEGEGDRS